MLYFTCIWRVPDALGLAVSNVDTIPDQDKWKGHAQALAKVLARQQNLPRMMTVDHGPYCYHILCADGVMYLTFCQKSDSVAASFGFLEEISAEFMNLYGDQVYLETRPYKYIKFDMFMLKSRKVFLSPGYTRPPPANIERRQFNRCMGIAEDPHDHRRGRGGDGVLQGSKSSWMVLAGGLLGLMGLFYAFLFH